MNRVLRRPMFKMGGSTGTGITSGLDKPRQQYNQAGLVDNNPLMQYPTDYFPPLGTREIKPDAPSITTKEIFSPGSELLKAFENRNTRPDLSRFLIDFGLNLASRSPTGSGLSGLISTAAAAAKDPTKTMFEQKEADDAFGRKLKLAATQMDIDKKLKEEFAEKEFANKLALKAMDLAKPQKKVYKQGVDTRTGNRGFFTLEQIEASNGAIQPIDNRMAFRFNSETNTFEQVPISDIERGKDNEMKASSIGTQYNILTALTEDMKTRIPETATGFTGNFFAFVEGSADQFRQMAETLGVRDGLVIKDESVIDNYLKSKGFTERASDFAKMKGSVINLGYALAKIAEPDNPRLSEGDIIRQLNRINFGSSRKVFADSLDQILKEEGIRARATIKGFKLDPNNFIGDKKSDSKIEESEKTVIDEFKFIDGVLHKKVNGKFTTDF